MMADYCPICGKRYRCQYFEHRCRPETLAAIDRARDHDRQIVHVPHYVERLAHGTILLGLADDAGAALDEPSKAREIDAATWRNLVFRRTTTSDNGQRTTSNL